MSLTVKEVNDWAKKVFPTSPMSHPTIGIGEEIGEYHEAAVEGDVEGQVDALADIGIFFFNICGKAGLMELDARTESEKVIGSRHLCIAYGELCHVVLKREQKIKGMEDDKKFAEAFETAANKFWSVLVSFAEVNASINLLEEMKKVFDKVVSKRTITSLKAAPTNMDKKALK